MLPESSENERSTKTEAKIVSQHASPAAVSLQQQHRCRPVSAGGTTRPTATGDETGDTHSLAAATCMLSSWEEGGFLHQAVLHVCCRLHSRQLHAAMHLQQAVIHTSSCTPA